MVIILGSMLVFLIFLALGLKETHGVVINFSLKIERACFPFLV